MENGGRGAASAGRASVFGLILLEFFGLQNTQKVNIDINYHQLTVNITKIATLATLCYSLRNRWS